MDHSDTDQRPEGLREVVREVVRYHGASDVLSAVLDMAEDIYGGRYVAKTVELLTSLAHERKRASA